LKKLRVSELQEGMVVASDIFETSIGGNIPLIRHGVLLNGDYIERLKNRGIAFVLVETASEYRGAAGETLELDTVKDDVIFDGKVQINCDIPSGIKIEAAESIVISGGVTQGCLISSTSGGVLIKGPVKGSGDNPVRVSSSQNVVIHGASGPISFADIKSGGGVSASGIISDSTINARGEITIEGRAVKSNLFTQSRIKIRDCGDGDNGCVFVVRPFECRELAQELLKTDSGMSELMKEKEKLKNVIELIKKLGKAIDQLPNEKKTEIALGVKRFKEIEGEISAAQGRKLEIKRAMDEILGVKRIIITGEIFPKTKITIESQSMEITTKEQGLAFCMKDFKVVSSPWAGGF
jgi:uncharacterized protein (DUF342 family)